MQTLLIVLFAGAAVVYAIVRFTKTKPDDLQDSIRKAYGPEGCNEFVRKTWPQDPAPPKRRFPQP